MKVIKRDGHMVDFCPDKIENAIMKANAEVDDSEQVSNVQIKNIIKYIEKLGKKRILVEDIQDIIEMKLMAIGKYNLAKKYITYRYTRELVRRSNTTDQSIKELIHSDNESWNIENSNKTTKTVTMQRDYLASITSTDITRRFLLPEDIVKAHDDGIIHFHGANYFAQNALHNSTLINLDDMLQNGTNINGVVIDKPNTFLTSMIITVQIIMAVTSSQYGEAAITLTHLAPFVRDSYNLYLDKYIKCGFDHDDCIKYAKEDLEKEITYAIQTFNYQINSMTTANGQPPLLSVCMYLNETDEYKEELAMIIEEMLKQQIEGIKIIREKYSELVCPKLLYVLEEDNIHANSKYYYLTELAVKCNMNKKSIIYISEKIMLENKINTNGEPQCYPCIGYHFLLTPDRTINLGNIAKAKNYVSGKSKYYGRFSQGIVTINLVDIALSSDKDMNNFFNILDERLELCHSALQIRHKRLSKVTSSVAPILWQHGAIARLEKNESIHNLLHNGYSTISLGYAGLYECVKYMTGYSYIDNEVGREFALTIIKKLNEKCNHWKEDENIDYTVCGISNMSIANKFATCLKDRFGIIKGITDKDFITNSYYNPALEKIDIFTKLKAESEFQKLSSGGLISYIEIPSLLDDLTTIIKYVYDNIMYAELDTKFNNNKIYSYNDEVLID